MKGFQKTNKNLLNATLLSLISCFFLASCEDIQQVSSESSELESQQLGLSSLGRGGNSEISCFDADLNQDGQVDRADYSLLTRNRIDLNSDGVHDRRDIGLLRGLYGETCSCLGDLNGNGSIDINDQQQLQSMIGTDNSAGDLNSDGQVDVLDLQYIQQNYDSACSANLQAPNCAALDLNQDGIVTVADLTLALQGVDLDQNGSSASDSLYVQIALSESLCQSPAASDDEEVASCVGDLNGNGSIDINDQQQLQSMIGTSNSAGDLNSDGQVDVLDLQYIQQNYDSACSANLQAPSCDHFDLNQDGIVTVADLTIALQGVDLDQNGSNSDAAYVQIALSASLCQAPAASDDEEVASCVGDLNGNGSIDINDQQQVQSMIGTSNSAGDLNSDGQVDVLDLQYIQQNYDSACSANLQAPSCAALDLNQDGTVTVADLTIALQGVDLDQNGSSASDSLYVKIGFVTCN